MPHCQLFIQSYIGATDTLLLNYFIYLSRVLLQEILDVFLWFGEHNSAFSISKDKRSCRSCVQFLIL